LLSGRTLGFDSDEYRVNAVSELLFPPKYLDEKRQGDPKGRYNRQIMQEVRTNWSDGDDATLMAICMRQMFAFRYSFTRRQTLFGAMAQVGAVSVLIIQHTLVAKILISFQAITHRVSPSELKQINEAIPKITILTGDQDNLVNPRNSEHLKKHMPLAELHVVKGGGHAMTIQ
jgi:hypothetical protein